MKRFTHERLAPTPGDVRGFRYVTRGRARILLALMPDGSTKAIEVLHAKAERNPPMHKRIIKLAAIGGALAAAALTLEAANGRGPLAGLFGPPPAAPTAGGGSGKFRRSQLDPPSAAPAVARQPMGYREASYDQRDPYASVAVDSITPYTG